MPGESQNKSNGVICRTIIKEGLTLLERYQYAALCAQKVLRQPVDECKTVSFRFNALSEADTDFNLEATTNTPVAVT